tara:strand:- start:254 stop:400 length:147 start_codon:yes stop_codon:yes gene_type:complete
MEASREILEMITLIEEQIDLSDYGENTYSLNELYYDFYNLIKSRVQDD